MTDHLNAIPTPETPEDDSQQFAAHSDKKANQQFLRQVQQAATLLSAGNSKDAIPLLERLYKLRPEDINVLTNLGGAYILAERHRHAVPLLERATELAPDNPAVWSNLAAAYLGKLITSTGEKQEKALAAYQRVTEIDITYPHVHYNMGLIYIDQREWDEAFEAFSRAITHNPHDKDAHAMRAKVDEIRNRPPNPASN